MKRLAGSLSRTFEAFESYLSATPEIERKRAALSLWRRLGALLLLAALFSSNANAVSLEQLKKRGVLTVCANPDSMPFADGFSASPTGLQIDLARALGRELAIDINFSWVEMRYQAAYTGCDAFMGVGIFPDDDSPLKKSEPVLWVEWLAVSKTDRSIEKLEDLDHLRVALQSGSMPHVALLHRPVELSVSRTRDSAVLDAISSGAVDVGFVTNIGLGWYVKQHPGTQFARRSASFIEKENGYNMGIGFRQSDAAMVIEANRILEKLRKSGELAEIFAKYGQSPVQGADGKSESERSARERAQNP